MNWYKNHLKIASITFSIEGTDKIAQPMNKLDIVNDLANYIFYKMGVGKNLGMKWDDIDPDTSSGDVFAPDGQINIYLRNQIDTQTIERIINGYNKDKAGIIELQFLGINKSGLNPSLDTARILITKNKTTDFQEVPSMNLSNSNAIALLQMLANEGVSIGQDAYSGVIDINQLDEAINRLEQEEYVMQPYTQRPSEETGEHGAKMYDMGRSYEQLKRYLDGLRKMINYVRVNNLPNGNIVYG